MIVHLDPDYLVDPVLHTKGKCIERRYIVTNLEINCYSPNKRCHLPHIDYCDDNCLDYDKVEIRDRYCFKCDKAIRAIRSMDHNLPEKSLWKDGTVQHIVSGYGCPLDGGKYLIAMCNTCLINNVPFNCFNCSKKMEVVSEYYHAGIVQDIQVISDTGDYKVSFCNMCLELNKHKIEFTENYLGDPEQFSDNEYLRFD